MMNKTYFVRTALGALLGATLLGYQASACDSVFVNSFDNVPGLVDVGLALNSSVPDAVTFTLNDGGMAAVALPVSANSPNTLNLTATVKSGSITARCTQMITNDNLTGQCSAGINPEFNLLIQVTQVPGSKGSPKGNGKDKGNAWGTYKKCFDTKEEWMAFKKDPKNAHMGQNVGLCEGSVDQVSCQFVPASSF